jgi:23S rRNA (cytidine2498-2'-O)-methyltransferase
VESSGEPGLSRRAKTAAEESLARVKGRMSRVAKLAVQGRPGPGPARGFFAYLPSFDKAFVSREAVAGGQRRMADDPQAPSRSYLKVEEAYGILTREPKATETVVDLGAAPGGWSYSAAKRGALVVAVDNGPLKGGAIHAGIVHKAEDAFKYAPAGPVDWLFCDMVEDPTGSPIFATGRQGLVPALHRQPEVRAPRPAARAEPRRGPEAEVLAAAGPPPVP